MPTVAATYPPRRMFWGRSGQGISNSASGAHRKEAYDEARAERSEVTACADGVGRYVDAERDDDQTYSGESGRGAAGVRASIQP